MSNSQSIAKRTRRAIIRRAAIILGAGLLAGCATTKPQQDNLKLVWPGAPLPTRIQFVRSLFGEKDMVSDETFKADMVEFLTGKTPERNRINEPWGIAVSDDGQRIYVSDFVQMAVFKFDFGKQKFIKVNTAEQLARPAGIALDAAENIYVVESDKQRVKVLSPEGKELREITDPSIERPTGIAIDRTRGRIYVADTSHSKKLQHTVKIFDMEGKLTGMLGGEKGSTPGHFLFPTYVTVDRDGNVYVADTLNSRVQEFDVDGKYVKTYGERGNSWGMFDKPKGLATDSFGNLYVADAGWSNIQIFNQKSQVLMFFGGRGGLPGMLRTPTAVAIDKNNRIYVGDFLNHRIEVYQLVNTQAGDSFLNPMAKPAGSAAADAKAKRT